MNSQAQWGSVIIRGAPLDPALGLPGNLCTAFTLTAAWPLVQNAYPDGNFQWRADGANARH